MMYIHVCAQMCICNAYMIIIICIQYTYICTYVHEYYKQKITEIKESRLWEDDLIC